MAKICTQCNLKHSNNATKCVQCGSELEIIKSDLIKKRIIIASIISILLIAAIVCSVIIFTGPKAAIRRLIRDFKQGDVEGVVSHLPDFVVNYHGNEFIVEFYKENVKRVSEYFVSYNIDKIANPSSSDDTSVREVLSYYEDYGYDSSKLEEIKVAWLETRAGVNPSFSSQFSDKLIFIKYDGKWYWLG